MSIRRYGWSSSAAGWVSPCKRWLCNRIRAHRLVAVRCGGGVIRGANLQSIARQVRDIEAER